MMIALADLNFHHLRYFWTAARLGSVSAAARELRVAQPTVSAQVQALERSLGAELLRREGRRIALTEVGRAVLRYADDVFRAGRELLEAVGGAGAPPERFQVGVVDRVPKALAVRVLAPALAGRAGLRLVCREGPLEALLASLAQHDLDLVLSDVPALEGLRVKAHAHPLGESEVCVLGAPAFLPLAKGFPASLGGVPMLLPTRAATLRPALDAWLAGNGIQPVVAGEFDDVALMLAFASAGLGVVALPALLEAEVLSAGDLVPLGRIPEVRERLFAITVDRRLKHPAAVAVVDQARHRLARLPPPA
jgi:LysR family transcriptional regulator, transcriptional activator of nhaA